MALIRVVLADDHAVVRKGIREFLEDSGKIEVLAETGDGEKVKELIRSHQPDVAVLDIRMPGATGIEVARWVREQALPTQVLFLSAFDDDPFVIAALQAGASGYVLKNAEAEQIVAAVVAVAHGRSAFAADLTAKALARFVGSPKQVAAGELVSEREREVLQLAAEGLTNRGIGHQLGISDRTVQGHLASIYEKLQVGSRTEAVTKALQIELIDLPKSDV
jgi:two-component system, NarL family, response regulator LiaR